MVLRIESFQILVAFRIMFFQESLNVIFFSLDFNQSKPTLFFGFGLHCIENGSKPAINESCIELVIVTLWVSKDNKKV